MDVGVDRDLRTPEAGDQHAGRGLAADPREIVEEGKRLLAGRLRQPVQVGVFAELPEDLLDPRGLGHAQTAGLDRRLDLLRRRVADLVPGREPLAQPVVGDVSVAVVGVLGEHRADELGDRVSVRLVDGSPIELAEPVADRQDPSPRRSAPFGVTLRDSGRRAGRERRGAPVGEHDLAGQWHTLIKRVARHQTGGACGAPRQTGGAGGAPSRTPRTSVRAHVAQIETGTVMVDGVTTFFRRVNGDGPPAVFVHGNPSHSEDWHPFLERMRGPALAFDLPGWGRSDRPPESEFDYSMDGLARFTTRFLQRMAIQDHSLIVHDWGSVALIGAQEEPERVRRLVIINAV